MRTRFAQFAWTVLGFNLLVIVWGALVRASNSGEGCGDHWPLCNGSVIPHAAQIATLIEFTHRASTGIAFLGVAAMAIWAWRARPGRPETRMAAASLVFIVLEALLGAGLVLFKYVGADASAGRAVYLSAHLVNTMLLLATLTLTAWFASGHRRIDWTLPHAGFVQTILAILLVIGVTGALAALSDTLYPAASLGAGFARDFSSSAPPLLRLRLLHPAIAAIGGLFVILAAARLRATLVVLLALLQLAAGALNLALLAPVWMQLIHLLLADALWIAAILLAGSKLEAPAPAARATPAQKLVLK